MSSIVSLIEEDYILSEVTVPDLGKNKLVNNNCNIIAPIIYCYLLQIIDKYWSDLEVLQ